MDHYFKNTELDHDISVFHDTICGHYFKFETDKGVFSKDHVDHLTKLFLEVIIDKINPQDVLDFGCGYGVIGMCVAKHYNCSVDMLDVNQRAIALAKRNVASNSLTANIFESDMFTAVNSKYNTILLNPPIRAGKKVCYNIYDDARNYLYEGGSLYIVISKKHGAVSTIEYLKSMYKEVHILYKKKGIFVVSATI